MNQKPLSKCLDAKECFIHIIQKKLNYYRDMEVNIFQKVEILYYNQLEIKSFMKINKINKNNQHQN